MGARWILSGHLYRLRQHVFLAGAAVDLGFVVLLLWLFTQLNPAVWLFGNGDLRDLTHAAANLDFSPTTYRWIETGVTAFNLAGICLFTLALARPGQSLAGPLLVLVSAALALKSVAALTLFKPGDAALWLTPGSMLGIPAGLLLYLALGQAAQLGSDAVARLPDPWRRRAVERCSREPVYTGVDPDLALRAFPELQRPHAVCFQRVAARSLRVPGLASAGASRPGVTSCGNTLC